MEKLRELLKEQGVHEFMTQIPGEWQKTKAKIKDINPKSLYQGIEALEFLEAANALGMLEHEEKFHGDRLKKEHAKIKYLIEKLQATKD